MSPFFGVSPAKTDGSVASDGRQKRVKGTRAHTACVRDQYENASKRKTIMIFLKDGKLRRLVLTAENELDVANGIAKFHLKKWV